MNIHSSRETFDRSMKKLLDQVLILGSMVDQAILESMQALQNRDFAAARRIQEADQRVNEKRYAIEHESIILIATQQPMARDVRFLAAILEIITGLSKIIPAFLNFLFDQFFVRRYPDEVSFFQAFPDVHYTNSILSFSTLS